MNRKIALRITGGIMVGTMFLCNPEIHTYAAPVAGVSDVIETSVGTGEIGRAHV